MDLGINGRLALVTGASRNIGQGIAEALARAGGRLVLVARNLDRLEEVRKQIATPQEAHSCVAVDLETREGLIHLVDTLRSEIGEPDILVHNLGGSFGLGAFASVEEWQKVWYFNVGIPHALNREFIPGMIQRRWGRVIHLSTLSTHTHNGYAPYVSAKCAVEGYVKSVNREVSRHNVIISAVAPGAILTKGRYFARLQEENPEGLQEYFKNHLPIGRLGTTQDIGSVVAFLSSNLASFLAGTIVRADGGGM
jgi:3-oxoacyl-[acyl-carrier protein] reductase